MSNSDFYNKVLKVIERKGVKTFKDYPKEMSQEDIADLFQLSMSNSFLLTWSLVRKQLTKGKLGEEFNWNGEELLREDGLMISKSNVKSFIRDIRKHPTHGCKSFNSGNFFMLSDSDFCKVFKIDQKIFNQWWSSSGINHIDHINLFDKPMFFSNYIFSNNCESLKIVYDEKKLPFEDSDECWRAMDDYYDEIDDLNDFDEDD